MTAFSASVHSALLVLLAAGTSMPLNVRAQIASPANAGQNSGNNVAPSSLTSIGTPNFSQPLTVSLVSGVTVEEDGSLIADPELEEEIRRALSDVVSSSSVMPLRAVATAPLPSDLSTPLLASAAELPVAAVAAGPGTVVVQDQRLLVAIAGEQVEVLTTAANQASLRSYVNQALKDGFTAPSVRLWAQLVAIGTPVEPTLELMGSLQGLASQPTLNALARGIAAFNTIVKGASPELRTKLNNSPVFIAASNALRAARSVMPSAR